MLKPESQLGCDQQGNSCQEDYPADRCKNKDSLRLVYEFTGRKTPFCSCGRRTEVVSSLLASEGNWVNHKGIHLLTFCPTVPLYIYICPYNLSHCIFTFVPLRLSHRIFTFVPLSNYVFSHCHTVYLRLSHWPTRLFYCIFTFVPLPNYVCPTVPLFIFVCPTVPSVFLTVPIRPSFDSLRLYYMPISHNVCPTTLQINSSITIRWG